MSLRYISSSFWIESVIGRLWLAIGDYGPGFEERDLFGGDFRCFYFILHQFFAKDEREVLGNESMLIYNHFIFYKEGYYEENFASIARAADFRWLCIWSQVCGRHKRRFSTI